MTAGKPSQHPDARDRKLLPGSQPWRKRGSTISKLGIAEGPEGGDLPGWKLPLLAPVPGALENDTLISSTLKGSSKGDYRIGSSQHHYPYETKLWARLPDCKPAFMEDTMGQMPATVQKTVTKTGESHGWTFYIEGIP